MSRRPRRAVPGSHRPRHATVLAVGACALALAAGCTTGGATATGPATSATPAPTGAGTGTGTATGAPPAGGPSALPTTADGYSRLAIAAWRSHDPGELGTLNAPSDTVFQTLNAGNYNPDFDTLYMCDGAAGSTYCTYYNAVGDSLRLQLRNDLVGHPHAIVGGAFTPITFPTDYQAYAKEALDDWVSRDTAAVALLTGKPGDSAFTGVPAAVRTEDWNFVRTDGAAGHEYYLFHNSAGDELAFGFVDPTIQSPPANRHGLIEQVVFTPHS